MHIYIKVPPKVAEELGLTTLRTTKLPDGNYSCMIKQFERLCPSYKILKEAPKMGCAILEPWQMRDEKDGKLRTPLPEPTEEYARFRSPAAPEEDEAPTGEALPMTEDPAEEPHEEPQPEPTEEEGGGE